MIKAIIPCSGLGTRIGMSPNQSKEMLLDPVTGKYVIDYSLDLCKQYGLDPCIITREGKTDLIDYVTGKVDLHIMKDTEIVGKEWPDSILAAKNTLWGENNVLILPDTRFSPTSVISEIRKSLELGAEAAIALHLVQDSSKWCIVKDYKICEKPLVDEEAWAFGLIGFKKNYGKILFEQLKLRGTEHPLNNTSFSFLGSFKDITRSKQIEGY